jgi:hypothetical protein
MGIFSWLFGGNDKAAAPEPLQLAAGRGFTYEIVGEAQYQDALDAVCGGKCDEGHKLQVTAQLRLIDDNPHDPNAVGVFIDGDLVGFIPRADAVPIRAEILAINPEERPLTCAAKIVGGWDDGYGDEGHYGVKLSIARPLRVAR